MPNREDPSWIRVLVVHPLRVERVRLIRPLRARFGRNAQVSEASGASEAIERQKEGPFDVVFVAETVDDRRGLDLAAQWARTSPETATILVADSDTPQLAAEMAQSAACDYVVRGQIDEQQLARTIFGAIRQIQLHRDYRRMVRRMRQSHDQLDHLIRALSHDMNANFMLMENSFSRLQRALETRHTDDGDLKEIAAHVRACMTESRRFLNDLVGLARTGRVEMEPELADTDGVVEEVLFEQRELFTRRGVAVELSRDLPKLWCNRHRLKQVVTNLVRNALKHGTDPQRPQITISGQTNCDQSQMARLRIHDNGPGIPAEWQEEIFLPGRRVPGTESDGSGMGLAIVRKIVQHYGGSIRVVSGPEQGTSFEVQLPTVGVPEIDSEPCERLSASELILPDRRLDHDRPHEDPPLHPHRGPSRRNKPKRYFSGSDS